jgi:hypothetical protein
MLADALLTRAALAADARWFCVGVVTAYSAGGITATIDGATVAGIRRASPWTPQAGQVALFAVARTGTAVTYFGLGDIDTLGLPAVVLPGDTLYPSLTLYPTGG